MKIISKIIFFTVLAAVFLLPAGDTIKAQEFIQDKHEIVKAQVLLIVSEENKLIPGTDTRVDMQTIKAKILEGEKSGKEVEVKNDYLSLDKGDVFYLNHITDAIDGREMYSVADPYRLPIIYFFIGLFVLSILIFGGIQGLRGLLSLVLSFFLIAYLLLPGILQGYSPVLVSMAVSAIIIIVGSYITHGFNKTTSSAVIGMIFTILITGALAYVAVYMSRLTGLSSEESVYLNFDTRGSIDLAGLLLAGILIGLLGVLYDAAIGQAVSVDELNRAAPHLDRKYIYKRALRIGREHIGALVNTLAIAYVGASLPLLLLFYSTTNVGFSVNMNSEIFATEIIRTMVGSIGLVLAVPITTLVSVFMIVKRREGAMPEAIAEEKRAVEKIGHAH